MSPLIQNFRIIFAQLFSPPGMHFHLLFAKGRLLFHRLSKSPGIYYLWLFPLSVPDSNFYDAKRKKENKNREKANTNERKTIFVY